MGAKIINFTSRISNRHIPAVQRIIVKFKLQHINYSGPLFCNFRYGKSYKIRVHNIRSPHCIYILWALEKINDMFHLYCDIFKNDEEENMKSQIQKMKLCLNFSCFFLFLPANKNVLKWFGNSLLN